MANKATEVREQNFADGTTNSRYLTPQTALRMTNWKAEKSLTVVGMTKGAVG